MRWCKHSIFSLWLRSAFDSLGFSSSFLSLSLIAESRKIVEAAHSDTLEPNVLLNMILQIVTNIDKNDVSSIRLDLFVGIVKKIAYSLAARFTFRYFNGKIS
jgi:hypothetical protein